MFEVKLLSDVRQFRLLKKIVLLVFDQLDVCYFIPNSISLIHNTVISMTLPEIKSSIFISTS